MIIFEKNRVMDLKWEDGFMIAVKNEGRQVVISANREGLLSLANNLRTLADETPGSHFHLDMYNSLEEGSAELVVEKC